MAIRTAKRPVFVKGRRMRVTRTDSCGRVVYGDDAQVVSKGFVSVAYSAVTNSVDAISVPNAAGENMATVPAVNTPSGFGIEITFTNVDPEMFSIITGMPVVYDLDGNPIGLGIDTAISLAGKGFAIETWTDVAGSGVACDDEGEGTWGYFISPFVTGGYLTDFSIENAAINMVITGASTQDGNSWGRGPYDVMLGYDTDGTTKVASPLLLPMSPTEPLRLFQTEIAPPEPSNGSRPLLDPDETVLASVTATATVGSRLVTIAVAPDATAGTGVWYDFGDDTWDYISDGSDPQHTYKADGTYTVSASSNGVWVTDSVVVPAVA